MPLPNILNSEGGPSFVEWRTAYRRIASDNKGVVSRNGAAWLFNSKFQGRSFRSVEKVLTERAGNVDRQK